MLNRNDIFNYVEEKYSTIPDYPWDSDSDSAVLRHKKTNKWYGLIMKVSNDKLGLSLSGQSEILTIKSYPEMIGSLRTNKGFLPAYHMNKEHWITLLLDSSISPEKIYEFIDISYELTK